jgi:hypothetical protein
MSDHDDLSAPVSVSISAEELDKGVPSKDTMLDAIAAIAEDGLVVLENCVDVKHLDALTKRMTSDLDVLVRHPNVHYK